ncbi:hypothetical protein [Chlorobium sp. N1]|uniref:hypothetical protein n=1 Tax=Chlorobium sp. N1 TaxID=2491138 RepID=UPI00103DFE58|nr:hypothetical protein [Chlorobium sp. N1]TCD48251.1 hypothetical protein E0L29_05065 [Chlorobium sp. N1]
MQSRTAAVPPLFHTALLLLFLAVFAGCSNPRAASESNFRKAVEASIDRQLRVRVEEFPRSQYDQVPEAFSPEAGDIVLRVQSRSSWASARTAGSLMDDLVKAGIAEVVCTDRPFGSWFKTRYSVYLLKKSKQKEVEFLRSGSGSDAEYAFPIGRVAVGRIIRWTEPAEGMGVRMSTVEYTRKVAGAPKWARSVLGSAVSKEPESIKLVLTNRGWEAE